MAVEAVKYSSKTVRTRTGHTLAVTAHSNRTRLRFVLDGTHAVWVTAGELERLATAALQVAAASRVRTPKAAT